MFWGLIMQPHKRYMQTVEKAFHLSMASLDASMTNTDSLVQVMVCYDKRNYLLCTLKKNSVWQVPLDLNFQEGTKIAFTFNGDGNVHLTGYLIPEDEGSEALDDFEEEDEDDVPKLVEQKKRKALNSPKEQNDVKRVKKLEAEEDEDDDDDDESDFDDGVLKNELDDDSDDDLDSEEDAEEDESDEEEEEEEEDVLTPVKPSKNQKQKQQNQQQNQQNQQKQNQQNKKDKNKIVNGKDAKPEQQGKQKKNKEDSKAEEKSESHQQLQKKTVEGGVQIEDIKVGNGAPAKSGKFVSVYYIGRLKNGKKFDQTQQGEGFKFRLGKGEVIKGWDVGVAGMKVGGKRRLIIPPNMAYGAKGSPPVIPGNSTLNFEVELKAVH